MAFELSLQGELYYRLSPYEILDEDGYEMLRQNETQHILSPILSQLDSDRTLCYDTNSFQTAVKYFTNHTFNVQQLISVLQDVTDAFIEAHEFMLEDGSFAGSGYYLFFDGRANCHLVYVPILGYVGCVGAQSFLRDLFVQMRCDEGEGDRELLAKIDDALRQEEDFTPLRFRQLLTSLRLGRRVTERASTRDGGAHSATHTSMRAGQVFSAASAATRQSDTGSEMAILPNTTRVAISPRVDLAGASARGAARAGFDEVFSASATVSPAPLVDAPSTSNATLVARAAALTRTPAAEPDSHSTPTRRSVLDASQTKDDSAEAPTGVAGASSTTVQDDTPVNEVPVDTVNLRFNGMPIPDAAAVDKGMTVPSSGIDLGDEKKKKDKVDKTDRGVRGKLFGKKAVATPEDPSEQSAEVPTPDAAVHAERVNSRTEAVNTPLKADRSVVACIVLSIVTLGIYNIVLLHALIRETNVTCAADGKSKSSNTVVFVLLCLFTFGIYPLVKYYQLAERMKDNAPQYGLSFSESGTTMLVWTLRGPLVVILGSVVGIVLQGVVDQTVGMLAALFFSLFGTILAVYGMILIVRGLVRNNNALNGKYNEMYGV